MFLCFLKNILWLKTQTFVFCSGVWCDRPLQSCAYFETLASLLFHSVILQYNSTSIIWDREHLWRWIFLPQMYNKFTCRLWLFHLNTWIYFNINQCSSGCMLNVMVQLLEQFISCSKGLSSIIAQYLAPSWCCQLCVTMEMVWLVWWAVLFFSTHILHVCQKVCMLSFEQSAALNMVVLFAIWCMKNCHRVHSVMSFCQARLRVSNEQLSCQKWDMFITPMQHILDLLSQVSVFSDKR